MTNLDFRRIDEGMDTSRFKCASPQLTSYFRKHALHNHGMKIAACTVGLSSGEIAGYFTTSMKSVEKAGMDPKDVRGTPGYPIPVILIGKLAVHSSHTEKGFGRQIMREVFKGAVRASQSTDTPAFRALFVETADGAPDAPDFYAHFGFKPFQNSTDAMYINLKTVEKAIRAAGK